MLNLIRMEISRLIKTKSTFIIFFAVVLSFGVMIGLVDYTTRNMDEIPPSQTMEDNTYENGTNVYVNIDSEKMDKLSDSGEEFIISGFSQSTYLIFLIVFGSLFFTSPYSHGFVKNFLGMTKNKSSYVFASFITASLYVIVSFAIAAIILTLATPHINDGMFVFSDYRRLFEILLVELLSHLSYLSFILLIANITRSSSKTLMVSMLYPTIFFNFLLGMGTKFLNLFINLPEDFYLGNYLNIGNIIGTSFASTNAELIRSIIVGFVIILISLLASSAIIKKKDI
ncbi:MAG: hypothetical protein SOW41_05560 [Anaerococcus sp.]|nr:hypothetical protein [Peptoniphilaceae bacterium]MDY3055515.1 hypothetical protein [Anaerococcus sp.]